MFSFSSKTIEKFTKNNQKKHFLKNQVFYCTSCCLMLQNARQNAVEAGLLLMGDFFQIKIVVSRLFWCAFLFVFLNGHIVFEEKLTFQTSIHFFFLIFFIIINFYKRFGLANSKKTFGKYSLVRYFSTRFKRFSYVWKK